MNHDHRTALIAGGASLLAIVVVIAAPQAIADLSGNTLPAWLAHARLYLVPLLTYVAAWAGHYLVTRDPNPPLPAGTQEPGVTNAPRRPPPANGSAPHST